MTPGYGRAALILALAAGVAGCGSARFGGGGGTVAASRPSAVAPPLPPVEAVPSGSVTSEPLPPPPGGASGPVIADVPSMPSAPPPSQSPTVVASAAPTRTSAVGSYTARDATGGTCRVTLSSAAALDLYRASASGCANKDLGRVTAWDFREGEVYLYQPGGSVAARLRGEAGSLSGVLAKSGAPLTLTR